MRTIATMLLVLMAAIYLAMRRAPTTWVWAPYLAAFAEAGHGGGLRRLVRRGRAFSSSPRAADSPYRRRAGKQAAHRRGDGALHHQQLPLPARRHRAARVGRLCRSRGALARGRGQRAGGRVRRRTRYSVRARPRAESGDRRMGRVCCAARDRGCPRGAARIARLIDPVGAGSGPDAARPSARFSRDDARPAQGDDREACVAKNLALDPQVGRRHDRRQGGQRADGDVEGDARPGPSVARAGQCVGREIDRRPRARPRDARARRGA